MAIVATVYTTVFFSSPTPAFITTDKSPGSCLLSFSVFNFLGNFGKLT